MAFGGTDLAIGISVFLRDQFTGPAAGISRSMDNMHNQAKKQYENQLRMTRNVNALGAGLGLTAINQMRQWTKTGAEFGYTMNYVKAIAEENGTTYDQLGNKAKTLGQKTMFTAREISDAMRFMAMAGQDTAHIFNNIEAATNLAGATMSQLGGKGGAADILTNVMKGFQIESTMANSTRVADVLSKATTSANVNLFDLGEALKYATSTAKDLNVGLEETSAMIMMAGDAGIQGSMAGTAIENMLRYVTKAAGEAKSGKRGKILESLGLSPQDLQDAQGNLLSISPLLHKVAAGIEGMGNVKAQNTMSTLFGVRGKREASLLLRNMKDYDAFLAKISNQSAGTAAGVMDAQMSTLHGSSLQLASAWETVKISFTEALQPVLIPLLKALTAVLKVVNGIVSTPFGKFLTIIGAGFVLVKTVSMGYRAIVSAIQLMHLQMGGQFTATSNAVVGGYARMTAAARTYATSSMAGTAAGGPMAMRGWFGRGTRNKIFKTSTGRFYTTATQTGAAKFMTREAAMKGMYGRVGGRIMGSNIAGKAMGMGAKVLGGAGRMLKAGTPLGLVSIGASLAGDMVGGTTGKVLSTAGTTAEYASYGAMLGSVIPGLGTAIGGLAGAVMGLGKGIWDWVDSNDENTQALEEQRRQQMEQTQLMQDMYDSSGSFWRSRLAIMDRPQMDLPMNPDRGGPAEYRVYGTDVDYYPPDQQAKQHMINIYIDGEQKMNQVIEDKLTDVNFQVGTN